VAEGRATTADLGGPAGTSEFADAIIERLASGAHDGTGGLTGTGTPAGATA
jgi:hypothetical protein